MAVFVGLQFQDPLLNQEVALELVSKMVAEATVKTEAIQWTVDAATQIIELDQTHRYAVGAIPGIGELDLEEEVSQELQVNLMLQFNRIVKILDLDLLAGTGNLETYQIREVLPTD